MKKKFIKKIIIYLSNIFFFLLGSFGILLPVNEYKAQGLELSDCDGSLGVLLIIIPSLLFFLMQFFFDLRKLSKKFSYLILIKIVLEILFCALLISQTVEAFQEIYLNKTIYLEICYDN